MTLYFDGTLGGYHQMAKIYDVDTSVLRRWIKQYKTYGTCVDRRGQGGTGRPRKYDREYESMSKKDLIELILTQYQTDDRQGIIRLKMNIKNTRYHPHQGYRVSIHETESTSVHYS